MGKSGRKSGEEWSCGKKAIGVVEEGLGRKRMYSEPQRQGGCISNNYSYVVIYSKNV